MIVVSTNYVKRFLKDETKLKKVGSGLCKNCYEVKNSPTIVVLEDKGVLDYFKKKKRSEFKEMQKFNDNIIRLGIKTPRIHDYFYADRKYYEIMQKVGGKSLLTYERTIIDRLYPELKIKTKMQKDNIELDYSKIGELTLKENMEKFDILLNATSEQFQDFIKMTKTAVEIFGDTFFEDNHGENIMYSKHSGFHYIDLPLEKLLIETKNEVGVTEIEFEDFEELREETVNQNLNYCTCYEIMYPFAGEPLSQLLANEVVNYTDYISFELMTEYGNKFNKLVKRIVNELEIFGMKSDGIVFGLESCMLNRYMIEEERDELKGDLYKNFKLK